MIDPLRQPLSLVPTHPDRPRMAYAPADPTAAPVATVITPYFNAGPEFEETARCVLGQSLQQLEWIIVNDGSSNEASLQQLDAWRDRDPRVRVIDHPENKGLPAARNTGFRHARTEFVYQLDADDLIEPTTVEKCLMMLTHRPEVAFATGRSAGFGSQSYVWTHGFEKGKAFLEQNWTTATTMVRKSAWEAIGGYDESRRGGLEDWDFWLRAAAHGQWGATIPEVLDWYRRRDDHAQVWSDFGCDERRQKLIDTLTARYPQLTQEPWPMPTPAWPTPLEAVRDELPVRHELAKTGRRLLMAVPWLRMGGADKFNRDLVEQLIARGWEVTIVTTTPTNGPAVHGWLAEFCALTPDIFHLDHYATRHEAPSLLRWLISSRRPDAVLLSNSDLGYQLLPWLRTVCPEPAYVDYNHMEEPYWKSGGHPRSGAAVSDLLDMQACTSEHLRSWMIEHGSDPEHTHACTINVDHTTWKPDAQVRQSVREELGIEPDTPVILYAGRVCAQKQPLVFARSIAELDRLAQGRPFVALVAGSGEDLAKLTAQLELDRLLDRRVKLLGEVTSARMRELMPASDIFFLPSRWEGIALTLYEAMACGTVPVGAIVGGQAELVTPETGILLPKAEPGRELEDEPGPYARALWSLIEDRGHLERMSRAARERIVAHYGLDQMGDRMAELLEEAIATHRRAPRSLMPRGLAREIACRAMEADRLQRACDRLWARSQQLEAQLAALPTAPAVAASGPAAGPAAGQASPAPSAQPGPRALARAELALLESSAGWKRVMRLRRSLPLRILGSALRGSKWSPDPFPKDPVARLAAIRASRSFHLAGLLGSTPTAGGTPNGTVHAIETKPVTLPRPVDAPAAKSR